MKKRYSPEQIVGMLRQADVGLGKGLKVPDVCKQVGISEQTYYRRRQKCGGMPPQLARQLKALEVSLAEQLRTMRMARCQDGESSAIPANNPALDGPAKLDLKLIDADQATSKSSLRTDEREADGFPLDRYGNQLLSVQRLTLPHDLCGLRAIGWTRAPHGSTGPHRAGGGGRQTGLRELTWCRNLVAGWLRIPVFSARF